MDEALKEWFKKVRTQDGRVDGRFINDSDGEEFEEVCQPKPTSKQMHDALSILRRGVNCYPENFDLQYKYENFILSLIENNKKQSTIDQYFKKK